MRKSEALQLTGPRRYSWGEKRARVNRSVVAIWFEQAAVCCPRGDRGPQAVLLAEGYEAACQGDGIRGVAADGDQLLGRGGGDSRWLHPIGCVGLAGLGGLADWEAQSILSIGPSIKVVCAAGADGSAARIRGTLSTGAHQSRAGPAFWPRVHLLQSVEDPVQASHMGRPGAPALLEVAGAGALHPVERRPSRPLSTV